MSSMLDDRPYVSSPLTPVSSSTISPFKRALLWSIPFVLLAVGGIVAGQIWMQRNAPQSGGPGRFAELHATVVDHLPPWLIMKLPESWVILEQAPAQPVAQTVAARK